MMLCTLSRSDPLLDKTAYQEDSTRFLCATAMLVGVDLMVRGFLLREQYESSLASQHCLKVGRVRLIFKVPAKQVSDVFPNASRAPSHLAYTIVVEWFTAFTRPDANHGLYRISPAVTAGNQHLARPDIGPVRVTHRVAVTTVNGIKRRLSPCTDEHGMSFILVPPLGVRSRVAIIPCMYILL
ncbi:uncharacterized protein B0H18DRAFT_1028868, partial [Fomitopsis serialis]|uniref:uncharacterized protein n=1 Tax=Fomitopsis serialis TaxID=139415 RepID=UPI0020081603